MRWLKMIWIFMVMGLVGCASGHDVKDGMVLTGEAMVDRAADRLVGPDENVKQVLVDAMTTALTTSVTVAVDRVFDRLGVDGTLRPVSSYGGAWWEQVVGWVSVIVIYLLGHRFPWVRRVFDGMKGKNCIHANQLLSSQQTVQTDPIHTDIST